MGHESEAARRSLLTALAKKYIWWKIPEEAVQNERRVIAQIMDIGDFEDVRVALGILGEESFRRVLAHAEAGWLSPKSWAYWHYRLRAIAPADEPPPMPVRVISA